MDPGKIKQLLAGISIASLLSLGGVAHGAQQTS